ncbi:DUF4350 domain-containing protein [Thiosocius teredinicola]|uniref:DUF4350 domain-containing protein n=1 Tax=Thiosocius teredinicola TaxID=1973002 RepID=UPI000990EACD
MLRRLAFLVLLIACVVLSAGVSERFAQHWDLSATRINSLSKSAERALSALKEPLEITAYLPDYPVQRAEFRTLLKPYLDHPNGAQLQFVDPIKDPEAARAADVGQHGELHLDVGARHEVVAVPTANAIDQALNRLALSGEHWIVMFKGHGEAEAVDEPGGLLRFVEHAEELGYRVVSLDPRYVDDIPKNANVLLIAAPRRSYGDEVYQQIERFLERGGQLLWLSGDDLPLQISERFALQQLPGIIVDAAAAKHGLKSPDNAVVGDYPKALLPQVPDRPAVFKRSHALTMQDSETLQQLAVLQSSPLSWNETGELHGNISRDPNAGEQAGPLNVAIAVTDTRGQPPRRALFVGGPTIFTNDQIGIAANRTLATGLLRWLTGNQQLGDTRVARDLEVHWSPTLAASLAILLMAVLPIVYIGSGLWLRRRRRKA